MFFIHIQY